jgi:hypothetical protein
VFSAPVAASPFAGAALIFSSVVASFFERSPGSETTERSKTVLTIFRKWIGHTRFPSKIYFIFFLYMHFRYHSVIHR